MSSLEKLKYLAGISLEYADYCGNPKRVPDQTRWQVLETMGYPVTDADAIDRLVFELDAEPWTRWVRPWSVVEVGAPITLYFHPHELEQWFHWSVTLEQGGQVEGRLLPGQLTECGDYYIGEVRYSARQFYIEGALPTGYHQLTLSKDDLRVTGELVICPRDSFQASGVGDKRWGITCQLYSLRSERNWGIGDFLDLRQLMALAAPLGVDMIALNPLHALCAQYEDDVSPYGPSDRQFFNPLYLAPELVAGYCDGMVADASAVAQCRSDKWVDYQQVATLKYRVYEQLFDHFLNSVDRADPQRLAFEEFCERQGAALQSFCRYEAEHNPFGTRHRQDTTFYAWLQWLCTSQLFDCEVLSQELGMSIGIVGDVAVGSVFTGHEVVSNPELYRLDATIGAPPDPFSSVGQNWGMPVINPLSMRQSHFQHFIELLRANMTPVGALRIDHAMSLMRLWWCLPAPSREESVGAYVYYPFYEMLSLLKLESERCRCQIIGEDLGVVAAEFRQQMERVGVLGNTLFYFELHHGHQFKAPQEHREQAVLMVTNHDVCTLADWWGVTDVQRRFDLQDINEAERQWRAEDRRQEKLSLLQTLAAQALLPESWSDSDVQRDFDFDLCVAIHRLCARSASRWVMLQLEDLQMMVEPINIPGTYKEYPNWRRKQARSLDEIFSDSAVLELLQQVKNERC